ncbi:LysM peptidoglycan-binding domain-containing protein [Epibacterium sp. SM1979]|uniref:LysM peptidoglycan-binding domain-containing protein n=1 Tax=Tritonibacter litoralis TaxID=2662264 RepID=A0A843YBL4_9RHOB|nr:LysM peptidoglycan-binding domain-containing protein [Tritonibacter litoralis]MQQ06854.1 LysM peptidoglycan-binding domain-containing protein [Tritonibacter litoralis]
MAGTSSTGGVGALTIAGVAAVVVIVGGVVLTRMGVFEGEAPAVDAPIAGEPAALASSSAQNPAPQTANTDTSEPDAPQADAPQAETAEPEVAEVAEDTSTAQVDAPVEPEAAEVAVPVLTAPTIDVIRFEPDGTGLIAGSAVPGAQVFVRLDAKVIEEFTANDTGEFVIFPILEPAANPRVLTFEARLGDQLVISDESFILAPAVPVAVAESQPEPEAPEVAAPAEVVVKTPTPETPAIQDVAVAAPAEAPAATPVQEPEPAQTATDVPAEVAETAVPAEAAIAEAAIGEPATEEATDQVIADVVEPEVAATSNVETAEESVATTVAEPAQTSTGEALAVAEAPAEVATEAPEPAPVASEALASPTIDAVVGTEPVKPSVDTPAAQEDPAQTLALLQTPAPAVDPQPAPEPAPQPAPTVAPSAEETVTPSPKPRAAAIAVLRAGPDGVEVVQPVAPPTPELADKVALDAISYTPKGDVELAGRARPAALVRVYIDNSPVVDVRTNVNGRWRTRLDDVAPGIYTLRLDELDPLEGKVLSRLETPFKREAPEVLAAPAPEPGEPEVETTVRAVTVQKGDTLWAISQDRYGDGFLFVRVFEANREAIRNPDLIYPGQIFTLPE